jgi:hypothetical protein
LNTQRTQGRLMVSKIKTDISKKKTRMECFISLFYAVAL